MPSANKKRRLEQRTPRHQAAPAPAARPAARPQSAARVAAPVSPVSRQRLAPDQVRSARRPLPADYGRVVPLLEGEQYDLDETDQDDDYGPEDDEPDERYADRADDEADDEPDDLDEPEADDAEDAEDDAPVYSAKTYLADKKLPVPSGGAFLLRPLSLMSMIQLAEKADRTGEHISGALPNHLLGAARRMLGMSDAPNSRNRQDRRRGGSPARQAASNDDTKWQDSLEVINYMCCAMITSMRVVLKPQDECRRDEVSVYSITDGDKFAVMEYALGGQKALSPFRR